MTNQGYSPGRGSSVVQGFTNGTLNLRGDNGVNLFGTTSHNGSRITNLAAGWYDSDAANLGQVKSTVNNAINNSGNLGLVKQASPGANITVAGAKDGDKVDFTNNAGKSRALTGVSAGAYDTDAVNAKQLRGIASAMGGGADLNTDGSIKPPSYAVQGSRYNNVGDALGKLDTGLTSANIHLGVLATTVENLNNGITNYVQQAKPGDDLTVGRNTDGNRINFAGSFQQTSHGTTITTSQDRVLTGVKGGSADNDAINVAQLKRTGLLGDNGDSISAVAYDTSDKFRVSLGDGINGTLLANVAPGLIAANSMQAINGGQLYAVRLDLTGKINGLDGRVSKLEAATDGSAKSKPRNKSIAMQAHGDPRKPTSQAQTAAAADGNIAATHGDTLASADAMQAGDAARETTSAENALAPARHSAAGRTDSLPADSTGRQRQITHVAAGTQDTDAANWGQVQEAINHVGMWARDKFNQMDRRINRMGAMSAANTQMAMNAGGVMPGGRGRLVVGVGFQSSEHALAVGYARAINERVRVSIGGAFSDTEESAGVGVGIDL